MLVEVYLLRCDPGGLLAYRRAAGYLRPGETPDAAAGRTVPGSAGNSVALLHSTSWRHRGDGTIVLAYAGLPDPDPGLAALPIRSFEAAASGDPRRPSPERVSHEQVAAHAARHLAFLARTDPVVRLALGESPQLAGALAELGEAPAGQLAD